MKTKMRNKMKNTTLKMIAITGLFLVSLNSVAGSVPKDIQPYLERYTGYHKDANHCISIINENDETGAYQQERPSHAIVNNCGFYVQFFYCSPDGDVDYVRCDVNGVHFNGYGTVDYLRTTSIASSDNSQPVSVETRFSLEWFACGSKDRDSSDGWAVKPNTPYSDRFTCYDDREWKENRYR